MKTLKGFFEENLPTINENDFLEIDGEFYMTGERIGEILGFSEQRISIHKIYERNKEELEEFALVVKMVTGGKTVKTRVYSEEGIYLISMFARTPKAKEFRKKVAKLLKKLRRQALHKARAEGAKALESLYLRCQKGNKRYDQEWLINLKRYTMLGLKNQEIQKLLNCSENTVTTYQKLMRQAGLIPPKEEQKCLNC